MTPSDLSASGDHIRSPHTDKSGYDADARARWAPESAKRPGRSEFERDRARVLHSAALRRLAATTQVVVPGESDFPRTRLTHSLECAQIGRGLGAALGCDPDLVETACLAHDLGHPPFGHTGEAALDEVAQPCGGFEGNAQSLRILTRLEAKTFTASGRSAGLNLTRASLDAATKYPWDRSEGRKYGVYDDDREVFDWLREGSPVQRRCLEAQVMDWADDVAYSVHDVEDAVHAGHVRLDVLADPDERKALTELAADRWPDAEPEEFAEALDRLRSLPFWPAAYDGSHRSLAALKNAASQLIGRFCESAESATREAFGPGRLRRYQADLVVPRDVRLECEALKAVAARYVMESERASRRYAQQRELIKELVGLVSAAGTRAMQRLFAEAYAAAGDDRERRRVVVDQVASLTDTSAVALHGRLTEG